MRELGMLELFSGIGGMSLGAHLGAHLGAPNIRTVGFCEKEVFLRPVLQQHWPNVPVWEDVRDVTAESLGRAGLSRSGIQIVAGGFPCQGNSVAGRRKGSMDARYLWPEMARIIGEVGPEWVVAENVQGILSVDTRQYAGGVFGNVLRDLAHMGYHAGWCVLSAADAGAPHKRNRVFILGHRDEYVLNLTMRLLAHAKHFGWTTDIRECQRGFPRLIERWAMADTDSQQRARWARLPARWDAVPESGSGDDADRCRGGTDVADAAGGMAGQTDGRVVDGTERAHGRKERIVATPGKTQSRLGRTTDGLPDGLDEYHWPRGRGEAQEEWEPPRVVTGKRLPGRADRLKALGNAIVPQSVAPVFAAIAAVDAYIHG